MKRWKWIGLGISITVVIVSAGLVQFVSNSTEPPVRHVGYFESKVANLLFRIGICHAWVAEVQSRESFTVIEGDPAAMEFDVDINAVSIAERKSEESVP